ncbi:MAG: transporter substrate-binding domain-containing protein, partial [Oscillospiraceae bacterium]|nr:transporter substrate-binding domain-containing protein [Oscillospiraceae bacterium]
MIFPSSVSRRKGCRLLSFILLLLIVFSLFPAVPAFAQDGEATTVRVGYYENEVFQEGAREGAVRTGYAYEYYRKLSEYTGWDYDYVFGSYAELYQKLLNHEIDLLAGLAWREDRVGLLLYPEAPMGHESYNLLKHASDEDITSEPGTMKGRTIVVLESAMVDVLRNYLNAHHIEAEILALPDYEAVFETFDTHQADMIAVEGNGTYGRSDAEILCAFGASDYYLCVNAARPDLLEQLDAAQAQLEADEPNYLLMLND